MPFQDLGAWNTSSFGLCKRSGGSADCSLTVKLKHKGQINLKVKKSGSQDLESEYPDELSIA